MIKDEPYVVQTTQGLQQAYDDVFKKRPVMRADPHYRWILRILKPRRGSRLADIACGAGFLLQEAQRHSLELHGIDLSPEAVKLAQKNAPEANISVGNGEALPWESNYFDTVACLGSLEHYLHPERGLQEIRRVLKPGGVACLMLPNRYSWYIIRQVIAKGAPPSEQAGFERLATLREWRDLIEGQGLRVVRVIKQNEIKRLIDWKRGSLRSVGKWMESVLTRALCPFHLAYHFVFLCEK